MTTLNTSVVLEVKHHDVKVRIGRREVSTYTVKALDDEIHAHSEFQALIIPEHDLVKTYDSHLGMEKETLKIETDFELRNAMKYCEGSVLLIHVDVIFPLPTLTMLANEMRAQFAAMKTSLDNATIRVEDLEGRNANMSGLIRNMESRLVALENKSNKDPQPGSSGSL